ALPDDLAVVTEAIRGALATVDLVVTSGGLGPTPDDLTREAIAAACGESVAEDEGLLAWLHGLYERRGMVMPEVNRKQAWLIPGATALPNPAGTAPGWWVARPDGRVIVALPGPPDEMTPVWREGALPRLRARGLGDDRASVTLRLAGIGESALVELLGEPRLRTVNPLLATYARPDAVDLRISAMREDAASAAELIALAETDIGPLVAPYLFARGRETWVDAIGTRLGERRLAIVEIGSGGQLGALFGAAPWLVFAETLAADSALAGAHHDLVDYATRVRVVGGVEVGLALRARERKGDTAVTIAADIEGRLERVTRTAFLAGEQGRRRAALAAAAELWRWLGPAPR
ncbi:MAG: competence/damage-inducible protein A, partial [Candidatus Limnocylindrales bacterium]